MDHLSKPELAELKASLEAARQALRGREASLLSPSEEIDIEIGDSPDRVVDELRWLEAFGSGARVAKLITEVQLALDGMARGTYGLCEETGEPIPFARLRASPIVRTTVEAQEDLEAHHGAHHGVGSRGEPEAY